MFTINRLFKPIIFVMCVLFIFLALSSASAANHNFTTANTTEQFQSVINNDNDNDLVISFANGDYVDWGQLNISRNATIVGKNRGGAKFTTSSVDTLFNINATNVKIINLTISGYATAIKSNCSDLTVSDNNITTSGVSINLSSSGSANPITGVVIKDNIIKSSISASYRGAVSLFGKSADKTVFDVLFSGNNITGVYSGVYLGDGSYNSPVSSANLVFENNNITGTSNGVYLDAYSSNNTNITFANNNITGTYGVYLSAYSSNNTNITFANNNITGTSGPGVALSAYSSNNTNITFANNNITGVSYGVYVYLSNGNVKGVNFLNNTINATSGDGFYFYTSGGVTNVTDFVVSGNTIFATNAGLNFTGLSAGSLVNVTVEYNRIIASFGVNVTGHNDNSIFDRNWWGVNDITGMILGVDTFNHFILNITNTSSLDGVHFGDNVS
ncbi:right-handed parallel beta-helix repeat-containing protein, partial [Methanobrevibacter arboriphilus]